MFRHLSTSLSLFNSFLLGNRKVYCATSVMVRDRGLQSDAIKEWAIYISCFIDIAISRLHSKRKLPDDSFMGLQFLALIFSLYLLWKEGRKWETVIEGSQNAFQVSAYHSDWILVIGTLMVWPLTRQLQHNFCKPSKKI